MSDNLEYEIERYLATCLASDDPDAGYMAGNVIEMCREAIAAEIETVDVSMGGVEEWDHGYEAGAAEAIATAARLVRRGEPS